MGSVVLLCARFVYNGKTTIQNGRKKKCDSGGRTVIEWCSLSTSGTCTLSPVYILRTFDTDEEVQ